METIYLLTAICFVFGCLVIYFAAKYLTYYFKCEHLNEKLSSKTSDLEVLELLVKLQKSVEPKKICPGEKKAWGELVQKRFFPTLN